MKTTSQTANCKHCHKPIITNNPTLGWLHVNSGEAHCAPPTTPRAEPEPEPAKEVTVVKEEPRTWRNQFPLAVAVPYQIEDFVKSGLLEDTSWGNDAMPSFEFVGYEGDGESERRFNRGELDLSRYRLWVDYPDANRREVMDEGSRFTINRYSPFNETELEEKPVFESNGIQETLDAIVARFFQSFLWVDRAIAMCPWSDCGGSDISDRHDSRYHDSMRPESGVRREELQCNDCGREWTLVIGKQSYVVINEGMRQITKEESHVNA